MKMQDCTHFEACSAPICPLDDDWRIRTHLAGERSCLYLREAAKPATRDRLRDSIPTELFGRVNSVYDEIIDPFTGHGMSVLRGKLKEASKTPSKMFNKSTENLK